MVVVTRSSLKKTCESCDLSQDIVAPPWCSSAVKLHGKRKSRKVTSPTWEIRSSYPLRENIWEYLHEDKRNLHIKKKPCCKQTPAKNKRECKIVIFPVTLFALLGAMTYLWILNTSSETNLLMRVIPQTKLISMFHLETAVDSECCYRMKHLAVALYRAEQALRNTQRIRRTFMLTSLLQANKIDSRLSKAGERYIDGVTVTKGKDTKPWGSRVAIWGVVPLWRASPPPDIVLAIRRPTPSDCWPFGGSYGELILELPTKQQIRSISIEHIQPDTALSAPKHFLLYGILANGTWIKVIDREYRRNGPAKQCFPVECEVPLQQLIFRVITNHGNPRYTCVYRVHLHGITDRYKNYKK